MICFLSLFRESNDRLGSELELARKDAEERLAASDRDHEQQIHMLEQVGWIKVLKGPFFDL